MSFNTKIYPIAFLLTLCTFAAFAQDLNPEVQVTNDYEARTVEAHKSTIQMIVPDSLTKFSTAVDYSVFATDYKGAYDFSPYLIDVTPSPTPFVGNRLYLKAGAGYTFHPTLRLVYTPLQRGKVRSEGYVSMDGYDGPFCHLDKNANYNGYDYSLLTGWALRWDKEAFALATDLSYSGIYTKDYAINSDFHKVELNAQIKSNSNYALLDYKADGKLFYSLDRNSISNLGEFGFDAGGSISAFKSGNFAFNTTARISGSFYNATHKGLLLGYLAPQAAFDFAPISFTIGAKLAYGSKFGIYPDFHFWTMFGGRTVKMSFDLSGGPKIVDYNSYKTSDHYFSPLYLGTFTISHERLKASASLEGSAFKYLQYSLQAAYGLCEDIPMYSVTLGPSHINSSIAYTSFNYVSANLLLDWESKRFSCVADLCYRTITQITKGYQSSLLTKPTFAADFSATYNFINRLWLGAKVNAQTKRFCDIVVLPSFVDLGLYCEYGLSNSFSLWAKAGNLLNQKVEYAPLHIAQGVYVTAGITLKLNNKL